jgi:hypothetical protein
MTNAVIHEDLLQPEATLPVQFARLWHGTLPVSPERALLINMLALAADDLFKYRYARKRRQASLYRDAFRWVASDDRSWPLSFVNICEFLNLSVQRLREELLRLEDLRAARAA